jgi:hypothetical protein
MESTSRPSSPTTDGNESNWDAESGSLENSSPSAASSLARSVTSMSDFADPFTLEDGDDANPVLLQENELDELKTIIGEGEMPEFFPSQASVVIACSKSIQRDVDNHRFQIGIQAQGINDLENTTEKLGHDLRYQMDVQFEKIDDIEAQVHNLGHDHDSDVRRTQEIFGQILTQIKSAEEKISSQQVTIGTLTKDGDARQEKERHNHERITSLECTLREQAEKNKQSEKEVALMTMQLHASERQIKQLSTNLFQARMDLRREIFEASKNESEATIQLNTRLDVLAKTSAEQQHWAAETAAKAQEAFVDLVLARVGSLDSQLKNIVTQQKDMLQVSSNVIDKVYADIQNISDEQKRLTEANWDLTQQSLYELNIHLQNRDEELDLAQEMCEKTAKGLQEVKTAQLLDCARVDDTETAVKQIQEIWTDGVKSSVSAAWSAGINNTVRTVSAKTLDQMESRVSKLESELQDLTATESPRLANNSGNGIAEGDDMNMRLDNLENYQERLRNSLTKKFDFAFHRLDNAELNQSTGDQHAENLRASVEVLEQKVEEYSQVMHEHFLQFDAYTPSNRNIRKDSSSLTEESELGAEDIVDHRADELKSRMDDFTDPLVPIASETRLDEDEKKTLKNYDSYTAEPSFTKQWDEIEANLAALATYTSRTDIAKSVDSAREGDDTGSITNSITPCEAKIKSTQTDPTLPVLDDSFHDAFENVANAPDSDARYRYVFCSCTSEEPCTACRERKEEAEKKQTMDNWVDKVTDELTRWTQDVIALEAFARDFYQGAVAGSNTIDETLAFDRLLPVADADVEVEGARSPVDEQDSDSDTL